MTQMQPLGKLSLKFVSKSYIFTAFKKKTGEKPKLNQFSYIEQWELGMFKVQNCTYAKLYSEYKRDKIDTYFSNISLSGES